MCEITAVTSGKGGSGKTMFALNMAAVLAMKGNKVLLIDMNTALRNLDLCLGLENQVIFDLADAIDGVCPLRNALVRDRRFQALYLLSAPQICGKSSIELTHMEKLCTGLSRKFDNIIIDTPTGVGPEWRLAVSQADSAVLMMSQEYSAIRCNDTVENCLREIGINDRYVIINRVDPDRMNEQVYPTFSEISGATRSLVAGIIQEDPDIRVSMNAGIPAACNRKSYFTRNFERICARIFSESE